MRLKQDCEFKVTMDYIVRPCLKKATTTIYINQAPVAHACNPSCSGDKDQEDPWFKASQGKQFARPYVENTLHKKGLVE
jgi:hypothetical protein